MSTDRNQAARDKFAQAQREREAQRIMREFAQAVSGGQAGALDRFGQRVEIGCQLLFRPPFDYVYQVVDVTPVLEPGAPAGLVRLRLVLDVPVTVPVNQRQMTMCVVGKTEAQEAQAQAPPEPPAPTEPTSTNDEPSTDDPEPPTLADA